MSERRIRLVLTVGDPAGIGPEITAALLAAGELPDVDCYLVGSAEALERELQRAGKDLPPVVPAREAASGVSVSSFPVVIDTGEEEPVPPGRPSAAGGRAAGRAVEIAALLARRGEVEGIVTGPISKEALNMAGYLYAGHTEMLAALFEAPGCQMMMVAGDLRVVILTRHIPLAEVPAAITREHIETGVKAAAEALRELWGIQNPRIAVAALNPHASNGGIAGTEERDVIIPALEGLVAEGIAVDGPIPADTLFHRWREKGYDAYMALYHDQGMIPFKMERFETGVNVTIGLPVVRTSVCHGTAFDIVGHGESDRGSLREALALAEHCCRGKRKRVRV